MNSLPAKKDASATAAEQNKQINQAGAKFIRSNKRHKGIYYPETSHDKEIVTWDDL